MIDKRLILSLKETIISLCRQLIIFIRLLRTSLVEKIVNSDAYPSVLSNATSSKFLVRVHPKPSAHRIRGHDSATLRARYIEGLSSIRHSFL